jgi:hypothetical protein
MNFSAIKYKHKEIEINKITVNKPCWIIVFNNNEKRIIIPPTKVDKSTIQTRFNFFIKDSEEELISAMIELGGYNLSILDKALKNVNDYLTS